MALVPTKESIETLVLKTGMKGFPRWLGHRTQGDPSTNQPNQPRMLINLRPGDGGLTDRAGWVKNNAAVFGSSTTCILGIMDLPGDNTSGLTRSLWLVTAGCPALSAGAGFSIVFVDPEQDPQFQRVRYFDTAAAAVHIARFGTDILFSVDTTLYKLKLIRTKLGQESFAVNGSGAEELLYTYANNIAALLEFDSKTFVAIDAGAGASSVQTWDGTTTRSDLTAINAPTCFALYREPLAGTGLGREAIFLGFSGTNHIRFRPAGDSPGTWTTVAPGAGTVSAREMIDCRGKLYIANGDQDVWVYDAGTNVLSAIVPATTGIPAGSVTTTLDVEGSTLYVGYVSAATVRIAKFDGTAWTGTFKNLTTQFATVITLQRLRFYRGFIIVLAGLATGETKIHVALASEISTTNWTQIPMAAGLVGGVGDAIVA